MAINNHRSRSKEKQDLQEKRQNDLKLLKLKNKHQKLITETNLINTRENLLLNGIYQKSCVIPKNLSQLKEELNYNSIGNFNNFEDYNNNEMIIDSPRS